MLKIIFFLVLITSIATSIVCPALCDARDVMYKTWTEDDVFILRSRMLMDHLILKTVNRRTFFSYTRLILQKSKTIVGDRAREVAMVGVANAIGRYLEGTMQPYVNREHTTMVLMTWPKSCNRRHEKVSQ